MEKTPSADFCLHDLISHVETKRNFKAIRFEPATYQKLLIARNDREKLIIDTISRMNGCSWGTALMIFSTSFGATQIMGFNLYAPNCGYKLDVIEYLLNETDQKEMFNRFVDSVYLSGTTPQMLADSLETRKSFGRIYNGAAAYADCIAASLKFFNFNVKD